MGGGVSRYYDIIYLCLCTSLVCTKAEHFLESDFLKNRDFSVKSVVLSMFLRLSL